MKKPLVALSMFTFACAGWLGMMEMTLRHPGYGARVGVAGLIVLISLTTILVRMADPGAAHFEGFVLVISVALMMQGLLTLVSGIRRKGLSSPSRSTMPRLAGE